MRKTIVSPLIADLEEARTVVERWQQLARACEQTKKVHADARLASDLASEYCKLQTMPVTPKFLSLRPAARRAYDEAMATYAAIEANAAAKEEQLSAAETAHREAVIEFDNALHDGVSRSFSGFPYSGGWKVFVDIHVDYVVSTLRQRVDLVLDGPVLRRETLIDEKVLDFVQFHIAVVKVTKTNVVLDGKPVEVGAEFAAAVRDAQRAVTTVGNG